MAKKAKKYSASFRANAVRLASESERPITEVARDLGVEYQTLYGWMQRAGKTGAARSRRSRTGARSRARRRRGLPRTTAWRRGR